MRVYTENTMTSGIAMYEKAKPKIYSLEEYLMQYPIEPHYIGYTYIMSAIQMLVGEPTKQITRIYKEIADFYEIKPSAVYSSIHYLLRDIRPKVMPKKFMCQIARMKRENVPPLLLCHKEGSQ